MIMKLGKARKLVSGLFATLMIVLCLVCVSPTAITAHATGADGATTESSDSGQKAQDNDLNDVNVSMKEGQLTISGITESNAEGTWGTIFEKIKVFIIGFSGIGTLVFIGLFIKNFMALGAAANNPTARSAALTGCLWTGIAAAAAGSVTLIVGLFWNAFK